MCKLLGYTKQSYYKKKDTSLEDAFQRTQVKEMVMDIRCQLPRLGTRKLYHLIKPKLEHHTIQIGRDKLFDILREEGLLIIKRRKYTKTTNSKHWMKKYKNLTHNMSLNKPEQLWVADITYLQTKQGHEYLHLITDAYSKQIMGYELSDNLKTSSTLKALRMALRQRKYTHKLIHHSDRGIQYCSYEYTKLLTKNNVQISMTEQYDPYENAVAERVNGILKDEFGLDQIFENNKSLHRQLNQVIKLYNHLRPHLSINMLTPNQAHQQHKIILKKWTKKNRPKLVLDGLKFNHNFTQ
jgi:putative transposase